MAADPYTTLGVARGASEAEIKSAYRKLAKELHPDRNRDNPRAAERFATVTQAYDLLSDKDKRARFDRGEIDADGNPAMPFGFGGARGPGGQGRPGGFDFSGDSGDFTDIFEGLFGGGAGARGGGFASGFGRRPQPKGGNIPYRLAVSFVDAAMLAPQRITLNDGKTIDLKLPAGVETGTQMRLAGKGQPGPGGAGDAIVTIEVQAHRFFTRDGDDVRIDLPIGLAEAVLGGEVKVPTVDGSVMLKLPAGSTSGKVMRLRGKGFHKKGGGRGDQLVTLMIDLPADDAALTAFARDWPGAATHDPRSRLGL
ncbi:DnaJ C-terminal domain-containing protein [Sphingomonas sp. BGYR3]|uniref:DnaJ C-terminal domain-containing protein n=1 Tax=Sphingomonas sp. BGYR3 TaxID=2975483 RepID=UPI0021A6B4C7|nr:DnaJ C-terminal domain-containing protein [Sphingomonas sp. BGYR3]MDG5488165.1 DnaJ C-terminal domain-containing protein [Sphingomonas sp. BGYR3]